MLIQSKAIEYFFLQRLYFVQCYSGTPPYDHPVYKTTSLLRPYSFKPNIKNIHSFYYFEDPVNATTSLLRPGFYGPTVVALTGFHCNCLFLLFFFLLFFFFVVFKARLTVTDLKLLKLYTSPQKYQKYFIIVILYLGLSLESCRVVLLSFFKLSWTFSLRGSSFRAFL